MWSMPLNLPRLWVVATPIGNLGDLSLRAKEILARADLILAEDTRDAKRLLTALDIRDKPLLSLFEHNEQARIGRVLQLLTEGRELALISSAGSPVISDPGYRLIRACREEGFTVSPVPGPCAPIAALMASGFPPIPFMFLGFLPRRPGEIRTFFTNYRTVRATLIFFERKSRLSSSLQLAFEVFGEREICLARELTKQYEEFIYGRLSEFARMDFDLRGELTILIAPSPAKERASQEEVEHLLLRAEGSGLGRKAVSKEIAVRVKGWRATEVYALSLELDKRNSG